MTIIGFNFNKIVVERKSAVQGKISISNNVSIKNIEEQDLSLGREKQPGLKFVFEFVSKYEPDIGSISLTGDVVFIEEEKKIKEMLKDWKKEKKVPKEVMAQILNSVLARCNVKALILSQDVNLPAPIPLPKVETEQKEKGYIG